MKESVPGFSSIYPFSRGKILKNQHDTEKTKNKKEWVPGFPSIYRYSMGKSLTRPREYKGNVEKFCERRARKVGGGY
jgi:hypothetical protein